MKNNIGSFVHYTRKKKFRTGVLDLLDQTEAQAPTAVETQNYTLR